MTKAQAYRALPMNAELSSSFGYPGQDVYDEFWRTPDGSRYLITKRDNEWNCALANENR